MLSPNRTPQACIEPSSSEPAVLAKARFASCTGQIHHAACLLYFLLFSSACTDRHRGGTQLSVSSKAGGLEKGHPLSSEGVCYGVAPSFSWSSSRSPAGALGAVCPEGGLVYRHTCDVSEPLDLLLFDVL